ncbi:MAG TPA: hypothetical protein VEP73_12135, partial [Actinomycetota bacterium]|nr:hypothetical protein [Actinomycetota bacterium]
MEEPVPPTVGTGAGPVRRLRAGWLLRSTGTLALLASGWLWLNLDRPRGPLWTGWLPGLLSGPLAALACRRAATTKGLAAGARRYWNQIGLAIALVTLGTGVQAYEVLTDPSKPAVTTVLPAALIDLAGVGTGLWALLRLPVGTRSRKDWRMLGLDAGTVMLAATVLVWRFAMSPALEQYDDPALLWGTMAMLVLALIAVFAVVKVVLAGTGPVDRVALVLLGLADLVGGASGSLVPLFAHQPHLSVMQPLMPVLCLFVAGAAERQRHATLGGGPRGATTGRPRRPYSLLPYAAVAAIDALLLWTTAPGPGRAGRGRRGGRAHRPGRRAPGRRLPRQRPAARPGGRSGGGARPPGVPRRADPARQPVAVRR